MDFDDMIGTITPEIYENLKRAIELGRWPDGKLLTKEQLEITMQAIIAYDHHNHNEEQRVGYIDRGTKDDGETCDSHESDQAKPIRFLDS